MRVKFGKPAPSPTTREVHLGMLFTFSFGEWDHFAKAIRDSYGPTGIPDQTKVLRALAEIFAHAEKEIPVPLANELNVPVEAVDCETFEAIKAASLNPEVWTGKKKP